MKNLGNLNSLPQPEAAIEIIALGTCNADCPTYTVTERQRHQRQLKK